MKIDWRLTREEYLEEKKRIMALHETPNEWARLSMDPTMSDRERMARIMMDNDPDIRMNSYLCLSYACKSQPMSQTFLEDAIYVNSGLCMLGCWDKEVMKWVADLYLSHPKIRNTDINIFNEVSEAVEQGKFKESVPEYHQFLTDKITDYLGSVTTRKVVLQDRLDWDALPTRLYSKAFLKRYQFRAIM